MKHWLLALPLLATAALSPAPALAGRYHDYDVTVGDIREPAHWVPRRDARDAAQVLHTRDGKVALLLFRDAVTLQLSDRTMRRIDAEFASARDDDDPEGPLGQAFEAAVIAGVRVMLRHGAECRLRDIRDCDYLGGRLVLRTEDGERLFDNLESGDDDLMTQFPEADSRRFAEALRKLKAARR